MWKQFKFEAPSAERSTHSPVWRFLLSNAYSTWHMTHQCFLSGLYSLAGCNTWAKVKHLYFQEHHAWNFGSQNPLNIIQSNLLSFKCFLPNYSSHILIQKNEQHSINKMIHYKEAVTVNILQLFPSCVFSPHILHPLDIVQWIA